MLSTSDKALLVRYGYHDKVDADFLMQHAFDEYQGHLLNQEYKEPRLSENDIIDIFGQKEVDEICSEKILEAELELAETETKYAKWMARVYAVPAMRTAPELKQWFWTEGYKEAMFGARTEELTAVIKRLKRLQGVKDRRTVEGRITDAHIAQAKQVPIETYLDGNFRPMAGRLTLRCPFHNERTPSFVIYLKTNTFNCFGGCDKKGGDVIAFVMRKYELDFIKAVKFILKK